MWFDTVWLKWVEIMGKQPCLDCFQSWATGPHSHSGRHFNSHPVLKYRTEEAFWVTGETLSWIQKKSGWFPHKTLQTTWAGWLRPQHQARRLPLSSAEIKTSVTFASSRCLKLAYTSLWAFFRSLFKAITVIFSSPHNPCCFWSLMYSHQSNIQTIHYCQGRTNRHTLGSSYSRYFTLHAIYITLYFCK